MINATDFYSEEAYLEALDAEHNAMLATEADAMAEYAEAVGVSRTGQCWILTDYDVWVRNPHYSGPAQRHPEDDGDCY